MIFPLNKCIQRKNMIIILKFFLHREDMSIRFNSNSLILRRLSQVSSTEFRYVRQRTVSGFSFRKSASIFSVVSSPYIFQPPVHQLLRHGISNRKIAVPDSLLLKDIPAHPSVLPQYEELRLQKVSDYKSLFSVQVLLPHCRQHCPAH